MKDKISLFWRDLKLLMSVKLMGFALGLMPEDFRPFFHNTAYCFVMDIEYFNETVLSYDEAKALEEKKSHLSLVGEEDEV